MGSGRRAGAAGLAALLLTGCSAIGPKRRYVEAPVQEPPRLGIEAESDLTVSIERWVVPNGPGAWLRDARWDEVVVRIQSKTGDVVSVDGLRLVDPRGVDITTGVDPGELETRSEELAEQYADIGVSVAIFAAPAAVTGAAGAAGSLGTAVTAAALAPAAIIAAPAYYFWRHHAKVEDKERMDAEFKRRQLPYLLLAAGGVIEGSQFFPIVPNPRILVLDYRVGTPPYTLTVPLETLTGLHVANASLGEAGGGE